MLDNIIYYGGHRKSRGFKIKCLLRCVNNDQNVCRIIRINDNIIIYL